MKKLMTMIAAVATAFGLYATDTGTSFEGVEAEGTLESNTNVIKELPDFQATALTYWANLDDTAVIKARDVALSNRPEQYDGQANIYCLELATGTKVIERYAKAGGGTTRITDGNLFFDSVVNMTAFEDEPTIPTDAKIAVWLQDTSDIEEATPATNLVVTINGENYIADGNWESILETWARVTVKALKLGNGKIGFVVFVNSTIVTCTDLAYDMTGYNDNAKQYAGMKALFPFAGDDTTIKAAGFAGKGSVDDLVFTETPPSFDYADDFKFFTLGWDTTSVASVEDFTANPTNLLVDGLQKTYTYVAQEGYINGSTNITGVAGQTYTITAAKLAATVLKWDDQAEDWKPVEGGYVSSFADALALVDNTGKFKIELGQDEGAITINKACDLTLDLAGYVIKSTVEGTAAIAVAAGNLTIIDSSAPQTGVVTGYYNAGTETYGEALSIASTYTGLVTINAGTFDGAVANSIEETPEEHLAITDGLFSVAENEYWDACSILATIPDGAEWAKKDGYFYLKTVTDFTVNVPAAEDNTTLAVTIGGVAAGDTNGVYTVAKGSTLKAVYTADEGYELVGQGVWTVDYDTKDTVTIVAPTAEQIMVDFTVADFTGAELLAVSNGNEKVVIDQGKYTVPTNATVTLYYAPAADYKLDQTTAEVKIDTADQVVDVSGTIKPAKIEYVAQINEDPNKKFETLAEAFAAVQDAETIKLLAAVTEGVLYEGAKKFTIDLNGQTWTWNGGQKGNWAALKVFGGAADITIVDIAKGGKMYAAGDGFCIWAKSGKVTINSGKFYNNSNDDYAIYVNGTAQVVINNGEFRNENDAPYIWKDDLAKLNLNVENNNPNATITVYGGTYSAEPKDDSGVKFVAEGKKAVENEGIWTVKDIEYATLTIATVENLTISVTNAEGVAQTTGAKFDKDLATELYVTRTPDSGYELDGYAATETITMSVDVTVTGAVKSASQPVNPGEEKNYDTPEQAADAAQNINEHKDTMINVPTEASGDKAAYLARVEAKVNGTKVVVDIAADKEATFKTELDTEIKKDTVAAALTDATATKATIATVAGFYYWIEGGVEVGTIKTNGQAVIGDGSTVELTKPALGTTTKAFYKLAVGVKAP